MFNAIIRFFRMLFMRKAVDVDKAADRIFTKDTSGIDAAFRIQITEKSKEYNDLESAVGEVENVIEMKRQELERLNMEEKDQIRKREGALAAADKAEAAGQNDELAKHRAAFSRFQQRITEVEERQKTLAEQIAQYEVSMKKYMLQLTRLQSYIQSLPAKKAEVIADHVSATQLIALNHRLMGIKTSYEDGPIQAVLEENRRLTAQARVTEKMAGTNVAVQDEEYKSLGTGEAADDVFAKMLAARRAEKKLDSGTITENVTEARPKI